MLVGGYIPVATVTARCCSDPVCKGRMYFTDIPQESVAAAHIEDWCEQIAADNTAVLSKQPTD